MEKPISLLKKETRYKMVELANNSGLPIEALSDVFRNLYEEAESMVREREQEQINHYYLHLPCPEEGEKDEQSVPED